MNLMFRGMTHVQGDPFRVEQKVLDETRRNSWSLYGLSGQTQTSTGPFREAVILDGAEAAQFAKDTYGLDLPQAYQGLSETEMKDKIHAEYEKTLVGPFSMFLYQLDQAIRQDMDWLQQKGTNFLKKLAAFYEAKKEAGDPIREITV